ncbi:MarR family transcriptional regulator [Schaedlerella arabinosiphila]|uniref:MarR family transcriptional regulator n=1 Tax=Schaedlerella arabinosiphila TaxID=2044587 RepID=A0A9X5H8B0_9FIRM|nr:MarR family transcriptional regulator [Schaedlerella arabinosiphila]KAI4444431.1 hypothetical protein C824_000864 [Schaedlerella arabinosiphila]NDO70885.1 MarR family transcriptional regulator [Schaedlerella arabinosiphila]
MNKELNHMQTLGVLGQVTHLSNCLAKQMFGKHDLKPGHAGILFILNKEGELSQRELSEKMNLTPPTITSAIQKMEKLGYIRRKPDDKDQRVLRLCVTDKGKACLDQICKVGKEMEEMAFQGMSMEETLLLKRLLMQVRDNLMEEQGLSGLHPPM